MEKFNEKFRINELNIKQIGNWVISLRPAQVTIGSLILSLNRKCPHFGQLSEKEGHDLSLAFKFIEAMFQNTYKPNKINYLALMMVDEQVHFHVIPRFNAAIEFNGKKFKDKDWPNPPGLSNTLELTDSELLSIKERLKTYNDN